MSPIRHLNHRLDEHSLLPNTLSPLPPSNPRTSLAAHSNLSDSACFQRRADTLSIIIRAFVESWGLGNVPGCVKVSMRKASSCCLEAPAVRRRSLGRLERRGREEGLQQLCFHFETTRPEISNTQRSRKLITRKTTLQHEAIRAHVKCQESAAAVLRSVFFLFY